MDGATVFDKHADEYDHWFDGNRQIYQAEVNALQRLVPQAGLGIEVGIGTGRFSIPFGIGIGVEPSRNMAQIARSRNVAVCLAVGEHLPFGDSQFDFALLVTVVCFAKDIAQLLREARRVTRVGGKVIIAFIDRDSALGQLYESRKEKFYKEASFYSAPDIVALARQAGLGGFQFCQTIMGLPGNRAAAYKVHEGYGTGAFVAASATRLDLQGGRPVGGYR